MRYNQQITVDWANMVYTAVAYLGLATAAWLFLRLIQACFCLPNRMRRRNDIERMLEQKVSILYLFSYGDDYSMTKQ